MWTVTETGQTAKRDDIAPLHQQFVNSYSKKKAEAKADVASELDQVEAEGEADWKDALLEMLLKMSPTAFERLAQRLLRGVGI